MDSSGSARIAANWDLVKSRMAAAALRSGRQPDEVTLVAVTKYARIDWVQALAALHPGSNFFGESRPQQLLERAEQLSGIQWHLIGPLQRNKIRKSLPVVSRIHSVDSLKLLRDIERIALELQLRPHILLEVNLLHDPAKHGFHCDQLLAEWDQIRAVQATQIMGLMTMAAHSEVAEESRPTFAALRELRDELAQRTSLALPELSMGMTGDYEVAIEEGATHVRIGSALWDGLE